MSYIGNVPTTAAFPFDQFSGDGTTTAFTLTYAPASTTSIIVAISGVVQNPNLYSVIGTTITFSPAPPTGTNNISVLYLGLPVIGVSSPGNTAYFSSTSFTATGGQTTFTPSGSYTPGFINVIRNGAQLAPANYTATNGTTVVLANACTAGDIVVIEVFTLTSISNALPLTGGTVTGQSTFNAGVNLAVSSGNVGIGTSSPGTKLNVETAGADVEIRATTTTSGDVRVGFDASGAFYNWIQTDRSSGAMRFAVANAERMRINSSGFTQFLSNNVMPYQGAPTSKAAAATLTGAELITGILNTTGTTYTITLPTGANIEGALTWSGNNVCLDFFVINTASGTITIGANGNTTLGLLTVAPTTSAHFRIRRTAANTFTVYRL
jgi:hypothetical protein